MFAETIYQRLSKNADGRVSYLDMQNSLKKYGGLSLSLDDISEFLYPFMPRENGMAISDFRNFLDYLGHLFPSQGGSPTPMGSSGGTGASATNNQTASAYDEKA
jgi:hypothetical protein